jgi:hypothetical protein
MRSRLQLPDLQNRSNWCQGLSLLTGDYFYARVRQLNLQFSWLNGSLNHD